MLAQFLEHRRGHIDGVRVIERCNHAVNRAVDKPRGVGRIHIARLDEFHHAEEAQHIVRIQPCRAQERARRKHGQHTAEQRGQDDDKS